MTVGALVGSRDLTLLASLLPPDKSVGLAFRLTSAAFHMITRAYRMFAFWLQCDSVVYVSFGMLSILERMVPVITSKNAGKDEKSNIHVLRMGKAFARDYRALTVLQAHYAGLYMHYISVIQTASIFAVVFYTYVAVIRNNVRALIVALAVCFGHIQFIEATAKVHETSSDVLRRWRHVRRRDVPPWFPRYLKSCRIVYVPVGSFFYIDRGLVLTVLSIITNGATSLILGN